MPRPLRIEYPDAWYHVINRSTRRRPAFKTDKHREIFLDVVKQTAETYGIEVHAYCLLPDQYHLLVRTPRANLSRAMRQLNGVFTQRCNQQLDVSGNLFQGRYKAVLVDPDQYLAETARYIHQLPVLLGSAKKPEQFKWSSCRAVLGEIAAPQWLSTKVLKKGGRGAIAAFLRKGVDDETKRFYARKHLDAIRGNDAFRKRARGYLRGKAKPAPKAHAHVPALPVIFKQVAQAFRVPVSHLQESIRGRGQGNLPRQVAMTLARSPGGYSLSEIAESLDVGHYSSVSVAAARLRVRLTDDDALRRKIDRLKSQLFHHSGV